MCPLALTSVLRVTGPEFLQEVGFRFSGVSLGVEFVQSHECQAVFAVARAHAGPVCVLSLYTHSSLADWPGAASGVPPVVAPK